LKKNKKKEGTCMIMRRTGAVSAQFSNAAGGISVFIPERAFYDRSHSTRLVEDSFRYLLMVRII
jgi:hypothetical protein